MQHLVTRHKLLCHKSKHHNMQAENMKAGRGSVFTLPLIHFAPCKTRLGFRRFLIKFPKKNSNLVKIAFGWMDLFPLHPFFSFLFYANN